ncbi:hypothetical protein M231_08023 [Tremella mesenterica]|uniref:EXS domain-containing protein n=1 Tax=Tremella mesenterica TaxID=5217 RepID=A0A4Q1BDA4_TREME|nr:hypothetical protein M231_08023 [Tremella mesenterica]
MWVSACQIWNGGITQGRVAQEGWERWVTLSMVCLPYVLRFKQCILEYHQSSYTSPRSLANAFKYFSAFPVILLSAAQKNVVSEIASAKGITVAELSLEHDRWFGEHRLFRLWLLSVVLNSMYSFYWDITLDWGLALCDIDTWIPPPKDSSSSDHLSIPRPARRESVTIWERAKRFIRSDQSHQRSPCPTPGPTFNPHLPLPAHPSNPIVNTGGGNRKLLAFGLRQTLLLPDPLVYHLFAMVDFVLRFTWSLKLSSHLHTISEIESGVFMMEALELVRRWMWVFVRLEWEAVKMMESRGWRNGVREERRLEGGRILFEQDKEQG